MPILINEKNSNPIKKTIKENGKYILEGVFTEFDSVNRSRSRLYYTEEEFNKHLEHLKHKMKMEGRLNKINKLNEKLNRN